ncbi:MAG TPA: glutathione peroxidase [Burkholderiales bacterium]|jgi:glutathione peroxidase
MRPSSLLRTLFFAAVCLGAGLAHAQSATTGTATPAAACPAVLHHEFNSLVTDEPVPLCNYAGKVVLVVNTASNCGYTYQYKGLEALYKKYQKRGLVIIGFPSNDFGQQEPGSNKQIASFCEENYGVSFPMFEKLSMPIPQNALYRDLITASGEAPKWNFHKYLIDKNGKVIASFASAVEPGSAKVTRAIEGALGSKVSARN